MDAESLPSQVSKGRYARVHPFENDRAVPAPDRVCISRRSATSAEDRKHRPAELRASLNYRLMQQGLVYPTYYKTLHWDLRDALTASMLGAKKKKKGVWKNDGTGSFKLTKPETITDDVPILPKLFRRLMRMYANKGSFAGMNEYLLTRRETVVQISHCHFTHFDQICTQKGNVISMSGPPEDFVFTS